MPSTAPLVFFAAAALLRSVQAVPACPLEAAHAASVEVDWPMITPSPSNWSPSKTQRKELRRGLISDIESHLGSFATDIGDDLKSLGDKAESFVVSAFSHESQFLSQLSVTADVAKSLGLDSSQIAAAPTSVINLPNYSNYTNKGWNMRFRANAYKKPNISRSKLDDLANGFLIGVDIEDLSPAAQDMARNLTSEIYVLHPNQINLTFHLEPSPSQGASGERGGGGASTPAGGNQTIKFPNPTTDQGDIDDFVIINSTGLSRGNETKIIQRLNVYTEGIPSGNATNFLVPDEGTTIVSDIDDILRVTKIWNPKEGILNSFTRNFTAWMNMPEIYANWSSSQPGLHFHYATTTPEEVTPNYMDFIYKTYPGGSFDTRPLNFSDIEATLSIRKYLLTRVFETFPKRKFVLVADTSNPDVMRDYPEMFHQFPDQQGCILLRNTSATDDSDYFPYDTKHFKGLDASRYMFFRTPEDLMGLDIPNGECVNKTFRQNVTFGIQGLPFGIGNAAVRGFGDGMGFKRWAAVAVGGALAHWGLV